NPRGNIQGAPAKIPKLPQNFSSLKEPLPRNSGRELSTLPLSSYFDPMWCDGRRSEMGLCFPQRVHFDGRPES
ncbi:hypothetical protein EK904_006981, partial [Melospiza melodia maxima]